MTDSAASGLPEQFDADRIRVLLRESLHDEPSPHIFDPQRAFNAARSDFDLDPDVVNAIPISDPVRHAAVLFPIVAREELTVLLTQRSADLPSHAGQIAFPGGKIEPHDNGPLDAALRETREEIGLAADLIEPIGYLDNYRTGTGFNVVPVVALVEPEFELEIDSREVALTFEVPLQFLMTAANHELHQREWRGRLRTYYAMPYGEHYIWGATAGMIRNLHERISGL